MQDVVVTGLAYLGQVGRQVDWLLPDILVLPLLMQSGMLESGSYRAIPAHFKVCLFFSFLFDDVNVTKVNVTCNYRWLVSRLRIASLPHLYIPLGRLYFIFTTSSSSATLHLSRKLSISQLGVTVTLSSLRQKKQGLLVIWKTKTQKKLHSQARCGTKGSHSCNWLPWLILKRCPYSLQIETDKQ